MSNDIDMWNDIEDLERLGHKKQSKALLRVYHHRYIAYNEVKAEQAER